MIDVSVKLLALIILFLLSAFFSASETALVAISRIKVKKLINEGKEGAEEIHELKKDPDSLLTTILIGNNLVNIAASAIATSLAIERFGSLGIGIATGVMTLIILTFCEIFPKTLAARNPEAVSLIVSKPIRLLVHIFRPVVRVFTLMVVAFRRLLRWAPSSAVETVSEEEVKTLLDIGEDEGVFDEDEKEIIERVFELDDITAVDIMTPREDMVCVSADCSVKEAVEVIKKHGYSRIPAYKDNPDNIIGILYAKDLLTHACSGCDCDSSIKDLLKPPYFVDYRTKVDDLLREFQRGRFHIAIVVDEAARPLGLVTLEDVLEELVGNIFDEYDDSAKLVEVLDEDTLIIDCRMRLRDFLKITGIRENGTLAAFHARNVTTNAAPATAAANRHFLSVKTVRDLATQLFGEHPPVGTKTLLNNHELIIEETDEQGISKIRVRKLDT
ncbi:MAG: hemolysin [Candidatus Alkanophagales archaeon]|nr:MAG: hemolysin [Candidatus Alkanophagales archaeon]